MMADVSSARRTWWPRRSTSSITSSTHNEEKTDYDGASMEGTTLSSTTVDIGIGDVDRSGLGLRRRRSIGEPQTTPFTMEEPTPSSTGSSDVVPLSMRLMKPLWKPCPDCYVEMSPVAVIDTGRPPPGEEGLINFPPDAYCPDCDTNGTTTLHGGDGHPNNSSSNSNGISSKVVVSIESILVEYATTCRIYGIPTHLNPGVLAALRYSLPTIRVSGNFFDADMLVLAELLLRHCNGALRHVRRLDFTIAGREGLGSARGGESVPHGTSGGSGKKGIRSHGAYALSRVLKVSHFIEEVYLVGNRIGPYGASAIFDAASRNAALKTLLLRGCRIGERGALAFVDRILVDGSHSGLRVVDLSACRMGFRGTYAIEARLKELAGNANKHVISSYSTLSTLQNMSGGETITSMIVDLEGNLVFQEVMNCVTHGLGIVLGTVGQFLLNRQIVGQPWHYVVSCAIYSASVITLYTSSTLYHSFFALRKTKFIFGVFDKCAIYLLIAGSYTPFLMIGLHHKQSVSTRLLLFIWGCAISGILVEMFYRSWKYKSKFSLAMYLGMGWCCLTCMPDIVEVLPPSALVLLVAGGVSYTGGVPFFIRNTNLDHSIWHMFVLAGSIFHWLCIFWYVARPTLIYG